MKINSLKRIAQSVGVMALVMAGVSAMAASTWTSTDFDATCTNASGLPTAVGGWGSCGTTTTPTNNPSFSGWSTGSGTVFAGARVYDWTTYGLGVVATNENSGSTGPHAIDNYAGTDAILFRFAEAVNLTSVKIGWNGTDNRPSSTSIYRDSDLSVLAWTGNVDPTTVSGFAPASTGWKLIGNYMDVGSMSSNTATFAPKNTDNTQLYSSYWLVSALSTAYGVTSVGNTDAFKVLKIAGNSCGNTISGTACVTTPSTPQGVPEPGSVALLGLGLVGLMASRRRSQKTA